MPSINISTVLRMLLIENSTLSALTFLSGAVSEFRAQAQLLRANKIMPLHHALETRAQFIKALRTLERTANAMEMLGIARGLKRANEECLEYLAQPIGYDAHRLQQVISHGERVLVSFMDELQSRQMFTLSGRHAAFYEAAAPFGEEVEAAFPSAAYDIAEAAKCRALGRWTAAVMHLMRVLEVGLGVLARHHGVENASNWNTALNQIEAKSREIGKKTHGEQEEQWASEAALHLRFVKNAWRNHAMHPLEKYDEERAVTIFDSTKSFLMHLATKLQEE